MKKLFLALLFVLMATVNVYAVDANGVWMATIPGESDVILAMSMESDVESTRDLLIFTFLANWDGDMNAWIPYAGRIDNNRGTLVQVLTSQANGNIPSSSTGFFNMTSLTTATFTVVTCTDYPGQSNCLPITSVFNFTRLF